jgi:integrase
MANYSFNLKDPSSDKSTPINLIINYSYQRVKFYTRESIHPDFWDKENKRAKQTKKFSQYPEFNQRLDNIEATAKDVFRCYQNDHNHEEPSPAEYKKLLETSIKGIKSGIPITLIEFVEYFIDETTKKLKTEKKEDSRNSLAKGYGQTLACLKDFAKDNNKRVDFDTMDNEFYTDFVEYLETIKTITNAKGKKINKYGFSANTIGKHIKNLKRILNEAASPEMNVNKFTYYHRFKVIKEDSDSIYLNEQELQAMYEMDLSNNPRLDRVRDLFLVGAWTGLRFSDFTNIRAKDIQEDFIHIQTQKTGQKVVIPIHWTVKSIMTKYKGQYENSLPPEISNVNMNSYLKEIGKNMDALKINESITVVKAGKTIHKKTLKWELLTTHTARRSFATNMYKAGVPSITIMGITGHQTEKAFLRYIKVTPDEHAKILMGYFQKQNKLRVV